MSTIRKDIGIATAYGYAKSKGYTGTEEEFAQLMADYASVGQGAATSAQAAAQSASGAAASAASAENSAAFAGSAATAAGQSAASASGSADSASGSALSAESSADSAASSAADADTANQAAQTAKTAAETAQAAAEEAARTLVIDDTLSIAGAAADAKKTGDIRDDVDIIKTPACNSIVPSKNLFCIYPSFFGVEINGLTLTYSDDREKIIVNGTATANTYIPIGSSRSYKDFFPADTFTFSFSKMSGFSSGSRVAVRYSFAPGGSMTNIITQSTSGRVNTVTFDSPANVVLFLYKGDTYEDASFRLQIESGTVATSYERPAEIADYKIRQFVPTLDENKINSESFNVSFDRYENIEYINILSNASSIKGLNKEPAEVDSKIRFRNAPYSVKCTTSSASTISTFRFILDETIPILGTQEIDVYFYVADATSIPGNSYGNRIRLQGVTTGFSRNYQQPLVNGWNKIRFVSEGAGTIDYTLSETEYRILVYTPNIVDIWIGGIYAVKPDKANIIIAGDGPYKSFYTYAYPALKELGVPVTWAGDWSKIATSSGSKLITQDDLDLLAYDGISEFSFHNWDGTPQDTGTAETALRDTVNNIRYLQVNGLQPEHIWRAAWQGNNCAYPELANLLVEASASHDDTYGVVQFPFPDRFNIPRWAMQGRTTETIDTWFEKLRKQHCILMMYTHGVSDDEDDVSLELLDYYLDKIQTGIEAGWLRATTFSRLINLYRRVSV